MQKIACINKIDPLDNHCQFLGSDHLQGTRLTSVPISPGVHANVLESGCCAEADGAIQELGALLGLALMCMKHHCLRSMSGASKPLQALLVGLVTLDISVSIWDSKLCPGEAEISAGCSLAGMQYSQHAAST